MKLSHKNSFTFVELLVAVMILSIAIGGVLLLYVTSMISSQLAWDTTVATSHAEYILEEAQTLDSTDQIRNFNWRGWMEAQGLNTLPGENIDIAFLDYGKGGEAPSVQGEETLSLQGGETPPLLGITVTVNWARKDRKHDVVLGTKLAK